MPYREVCRVKEKIVIMFKSLKSQVIFKVHKFKKFKLLLL